MTIEIEAGASQLQPSMKTATKYIMSKSAITGLPHRGVTHPCSELIMVCASEQSL